MSTVTAPPNLTPQPTTPAHDHRPATFADAVRSEWIKLTTVRSTWITLVVAVALGVGFGALISYLTGSHYATSGDRASWDPTFVSFLSFVISRLAIAVLGVMVVTSEYATGMIRTSLTATPRRGRFLASKMLVFTTLILVVSEVMAFAAFFIGQALIGLNAPNASLGAPGVLRAVIGAGLYLAVIGLLASAVGALLRNTAAGISTMVALMFVLPIIVQLLPTSWKNPVSEFWPTQAGGQIFVIRRDAHTLAAWSGFGEMVLFTAIVVAAAFYMIRRRDA